MLLLGAFEPNRLAERLQRVRQNPIAAYGIAIGAVAVATALRWTLEGEILRGLPFLTYFPAIIVAALFGGLWPGLLATFLSAIVAWYAFIPPLGFEFAQRQMTSVLLFAVIAVVMVGIIALLNAALERLAAQERNVRVLVESSPNGIVLVDEKGMIRLVNRSTENLFGYKRLELLGQSVEVLVPDRTAGGHHYVRKTFQEKPEARAMGVGRDLSGRRKDGSEFPVEIGLNPIGAGGEGGVLATVIDISERKRAQDRQQLLVGELQHRTQNLFTVIQAVTSHSLTEGRSVSEVKGLLSGRLMALARAHAMLAKAAWEGAPLAEIVERELAGFPRRMTLNGCNIVVNPTAAQQFALIVHELATNAVKHGALSVPEGRISIEGRVDYPNGEHVFSFIWKEIGGPPVTQPTRKGFGSSILIDSARRFGKSVTLDYATQGINYELRLSLNAIQASANSNASAAS